MPFRELKPNALDRISLLGFSPFDDFLVAASYNCTVHLFDHHREKVLSDFSSPAPILCQTNTSSRATYAGLLDGTVRVVDYENISIHAELGRGLATTDISQLINQISSMGQNTLLATTYGGSMRLYDPRALVLSQTHDTGGKVFSMDVSRQYVTLAKAQLTVEIYDVRNLSKHLHTRPSGLRYQVTALRNLPDMGGYALSSVDGRVSVEYYDELPDAQANKYAFKCHRRRSENQEEDVVFPVTSLKFHPNYGSMFTAGGDGNVCVWNWRKKKRMRILTADDNMGPISQMELSSDGSWMALGVSDDTYTRAADFDAVEKGWGKVFVRPLSEHECKPK